MANNAMIWKGSVNGVEREMHIPPAMRLSELLRDHLGLNGLKVSCEIGRCGSCMILLDGAAVNSCLLMAYQCVGGEIITIEGLSDMDKEEALHPVQQAFLEEGAFQCGYCTPGMLISSVSLLNENPNPSREEIIDALSGNLCRCTGYGPILRAVEKAAQSQSN
ncbi:(2Fe-2S)-binding protein [Gorillibacterium massiliense]|uniref:(2Fe-2S)-binding protein n=1 Tax=Gorillibacterium massiliense TaxID=1280390 RepID=UPI00059364F1|nr:(2Fe-2S)-binding protein [Gorillibacterium massiliense]